MTDDELKAKIVEPPQPAAPPESEGQKHRERMADFGQYMFDAVEALTDPISEGGPLVDSKLIDVTDAYITAWKKLKALNNQQAARIRELEAIAKDLYEFTDHRNDCELRGSCRGGVCTCGRNQADASYADYRQKHGGK